MENRRLRLELLCECSELNGRLWVLELSADEHGVFRLYRHYGRALDDKLTNRVESITEHLEEGLHMFEAALKKKLDKKKFRRLRNGEGLHSSALLSLLTGKAQCKKPIPAKKPNIQTERPEYRKLVL